MTSKEQLREEWMNFLDMEYYHGDLNVAKRHDANTFADWWLSKLSLYTSQLKSVIQDLPLDIGILAATNFSSEAREYINGCNNTKQQILKLISNTHTDE